MTPFAAFERAGNAVQLHRPRLSLILHSANPVAKAAEDRFLPHPRGTEEMNMQKLYYLYVIHLARTSGTFEINCCKLLSSGFLYLTRAAGSPVILERMIPRDKHTT